MEEKIYLCLVLRFLSHLLLKNPCHRVLNGTDFIIYWNFQLMKFCQPEFRNSKNMTLRPRFYKIALGKI